MIIMWICYACDAENIVMLFNINLHITFDNIDNYGEDVARDISTVAHAS